MDCFQRARTLFQQCENTQAEAIALSNLGDGHRLLGHPVAAIDSLRQALALQERVGDRAGQRYTLGDVYADAEHHHKAIATHEHALAAYQESSDTRGSARILHRLGRILATAGRPEQAGAHLRQAFEIFTEADAVNLEP